MAALIPVVHDPRTGLPSSEKGQVFFYCLCVKPLMSAFLFQVVKVTLSQKQSFKVCL